MKKANWLLIIFLLLSACATPSGNVEEKPGGVEPTSAPTLEPTPILPPALEGDIEVQELMLTSASRWKALQSTYSVTSYPAEGSDAQPEVKSHQVWIRLPGEFKVVVSTPNSGIELIRVSNGKTITDSTGDRSDLPPAALEPFNPPTTLSDTVYTHPLAGSLGTPVGDLIFPAGLAQRGGQYNLTGKEIIAGREADVVEWSREEGTLIDRFWVDRATGIILRQQNYGKPAGESPIWDIQATHIAVDPLFTDNVFELAQVPEPTPTLEGPPAGAAFVETLPQVLNVRSGPNTGYEIVATVESGKKLPVIGKTEAEDWWKVDLGDGLVGWVVATFVDFTGEADKVPVVNY